MMGRDGGEGNLAGRVNTVQCIISALPSHTWGTVGANSSLGPALLPEQKSRTELRAWRLRGHNPHRISWQTAPGPTRQGETGTPGNGLISWSLAKSSSDRFLADWLFPVPGGPWSSAKQDLTQPEACVCMAVELKMAFNF